jgi:hypothetical protein
MDLFGISRRLFSERLSSRYFTKDGLGYQNATLESVAFCNRGLVLPVAKRNSSSHVVLVVSFKPVNFLAEF